MGSLEATPSKTARKSLTALEFEVEEVDDVPGVGAMTHVGR